jgi:hypothetical protein
VTRTYLALCSKQQYARPSHESWHLSPRVLCSARVMLSPTSSLLRPDPPLWATPSHFPVFPVIGPVLAIRSCLGCHPEVPCFTATLLPNVPSPLRREESWVLISGLPQLQRPSPRKKRIGSSSIPPLASGGSLSRRCSIHFMLRPAWLLASWTSPT